MSALTCNNLTKKYRHNTALSNCSLELPQGSVVAIVGPNGAGKTTLLQLATGLLEPTSGSIAVFGDLAPGSTDALHRVAFVAQDTPLYKSMSVETILKLTRALNGLIDTDFALNRLQQLGIPLRRKLGKLSGGQKAQVALTLALARRPRLLILDEPTAGLDPLARFEFLGLLMSEVANAGMTVLFSSHTLADLERVSDYLVLLAEGSVRLTGPIDEIVDAHWILTGPRTAIENLRGVDVIEFGSGIELGHHLVHGARSGDLIAFDPRKPSLEEIVLSYLRRYQVPMAQDLETVR